MEKNSKPKSRDKLFRFKYCAFDLFRLSGFIPNLIFFRPKFYYESKKAKKKIRGAAIVIANHSTYIDPFKFYTALWYRRINIVATDVLFRGLVLRWCLTRGMCIPVNTEKPGVKFLNTVCDRLNHGCVVGLFPEGHINHDKDTTLDFKTGTLLIAMRSDVPIIPIYFKPREHWYKRQIFVLGEPIYPKDLMSGERMTMAEMESAANFLQNKMNELKLMGG